MSIPRQKLHAPQKSNEHFDITHPDSLIKPREYDWRLDRLDKFMRRAAKPTAKPARRHIDRLAIIDYLLSVKTNSRLIDAILACIKAATWVFPHKGHRLERALTVLQEEEYLDQCGGVLVLPISTEVRRALAAEAGGAIGQFDRAAAILEEHFGLKPSQKSSFGDVSDSEINRALDEIGRLSDEDEL